MTSIGSYRSIQVAAVILACGISTEAQLVAQTLLGNAAPREVTHAAGWALGDDDSLRKAAKKGDLARLETILRSGVAVDAADKKGQTALIEAAAGGQTEAVKLLLQYGAKPNTQDKEGFTALRVASLEGHTETVRALLDGGADINFKHKEGLTVLMVAAAKGRTEVVRLLSSRGADLKAQSDLLGFDALCYASLEREAGTFRWSRSKQGMPKYAETIQALLDAGALPATCFIDPNYLENAPQSFAILPIQDLRAAGEKKSAPEAPQKLAESLAKEFKPRKYEILTVTEVEKKLGAAAGADSKQTIEPSIACSALGTEGVLQVQLLDSWKVNIGVAKGSSLLVSATLTSCKSHRILWKDLDIYHEHRGFIIGALVSGERLIAATMVTKLPPRPKEKSDK